MEFQVRYGFAIRSLGLSYGGMTIFRILSTHGGGWSISALAEFSGMSRAGVRSILRAGEGDGAFEKGPKGYSMTDEGARLFSLIHRQAVGISMGRRAGFTRELIRYMRDLDLPNPTSSAARLSFSILKPIRIDG